ncbi:hypothetical protein FEA34_00675 [Mannheimia haemolytica]|nr:hypothetical protein COK_0528 [Mannheimia haemolytica serotype A2 str. BOVINE]TRC03303.1 hypothetical protein FEA39_12460 [Mannheimia haemolytica]TRC08608.1 hypothetical protein FEA43_12465 [Mannheimia haemolytica]TRC12645.1 hypothetical protein FEA41_12420 [Mannheimia haemolytica]TRC18781.1 hypothetical protein FEA50_00390 [Mannheimia haemolytica]
MVVVALARSVFSPFALVKPLDTLVICLLPALIPVLVTLGPLAIVNPESFKVVLPIVTEPSLVKFTSLDNLTTNPLLVFTTPILLSANLVKSAPPVTFKVWLSFLVIT